MLLKLTQYKACINESRVFIVSIVLRVVLMVSIRFFISFAAAIVSIVTVFLFSMYQLFLSKKCEYQQRLLNVLYFQVAIFLQLGVILNLMKIVFFFIWIETEILHQVFSVIKCFQVTSGFLYGFCIGKFYSFFELGGVRKKWHGKVFF